MKKILFGSVLISTSALALGIDINTKIKWNSGVVVAAANDVGLQDDTGTHSEVVKTYYRILDNLLVRDVFSVADAVSVCNQECNKSQFLRDGRGQSGRKCPEICKGFGEALITENNEAARTGIYGESCYQPLGRVYSNDKKFYTSLTNKDSYNSISVFEAQTNKKIAIYLDAWGEDGYSETFFKVIDSYYQDYVFTESCNGHGECCVLVVESATQLAHDSYKQDFSNLTRCLDDFKKIDYSELNKWLSLDIFYPSSKKDIQNIYNKRDFAEKLSGFTSTSYDLHEKMKRIYKEYCPVQLPVLDRIRRGLDEIEKLFSDSAKLFAETQTKTLAEAREEILKHFPYWLDKTLDTSKLKCTGDCNKFGQDYVTCTYGYIKGTFEFDDICQSKVEGLLNSMF